MKLRRNRRGFTIVELVIVVAVIGVLAAVLIPTFVNLTNKANKAADNSLVANLNTALAGIEGEPDDTKNETMHDAMMDLEKWGYKLENLQTRSSEKLLWNEKTNRFVLEGAKEVKESATKEQFWKIVKSTAEMESYSGYAHTSFASKDITVSAGFDTGDVVFDSIRFELGETVEKTVTIRTNSAATTVTINAKKATVNHFNSVGKVDVEKIDMNCYNEHGKAAYVKVTEGAVVAKSGGEIAIVFANNNDGSKVAVIEEEGGEIETGYTSIQPVSDENKTRDGGIELEYSIDGTTAATMTEEQKETALQEQEENIQEEVEQAVDTMAGEEVASDPKAETYVARIGTKGYETFKAAVDAAQAGEKIHLLRDFSIGEDIGELSQNPGEGWIGGLHNEVVLSDDITITFLGATQLHFHEGSAMRMNGHALTLYATSNDAGLFLVEIDEELDQAISESGAALTLRNDIEYIQTATLTNYVRFYNGKWEKASQIGGGGASVVAPFDEEDYEEVSAGGLQINSGDTATLSISDLDGLNNPTVTEWLVIEGDENNLTIVSEDLTANTITVRGTYGSNPNFSGLSAGRVGVKLVDGLDSYIYYWTITVNPSLSF